MAAKGADIAVKGGVLVDGKEMRRGDIFIKDGLVDGIERSESTRSAQSVIDATGKFVLPGIIEAHCHPVYADRFDTFSKSAAYGGITTIIPYIGVVKSWGKTGNLLNTVKEFIEEGQNTSMIDFAVNCTLVHSDMETAATLIPEIVGLGVTSFKGFMAYSKRGMMLQDEELIKLMEVIVQNRALYAVHAENGTVIDYLEGKFISQGKITPEFYYQSRPNILEAEAVFRVATLAKIMKCPLYLPHLSTRESLKVVKLFKDWGESTLFAETCTHYLTLTDEEVKKRGSLAKVGPPLRQQEDVEELWKAVKEGLIDVIGASDAGGIRVHDKEPLWTDIFAAPSGLPGVETMFTVTYDEGVNKGRITLPQLVRLACENPARIFGLYPKKGVLENGSDADLVIFDPTIAHTIKAENQHTNCDYTVYDGRQCLGLPVLVMQRGNILMEHGKLMGVAGQGKYLPRKIRY